MKAVLEPATDCNDLDATVNPSARDIVLDGIDQNCDGGDDCYADADGDGYAAADGTTVVSADFDCTDPGEAGVTVPATDCNDSDPLVNPGAPETAGDEVDLNCDGMETCLADADLDGYAADGGVTSSPMTPTARIPAKPSSAIPPVTAMTTPRSTRVPKRSLRMASTATATARNMLHRRRRRRRTGHCFFAHDVGRRRLR